MKLHDDRLRQIKIDQRVPDVIAGLIPDLRRSGSDGYTARVPWREDRRPSFTLRRMGDGVWLWRDWADSSSHGDAIDLVRQLRQCGFNDAVQWLLEQLGISLPDRPVSFRRQSLAAPSQRQKALARLWAIACPLDDGTDAAAYLAKRGLLEAARSLDVRCFSGGEPAKFIGQGDQLGLFAVETWIKKRLPFLVYGGQIMNDCIGYRFRLCLSQREAQNAGLKAAHCSPVTDGLTLPRTWPSLPENVPSEIIFTEGETDALAVRTLVPGAHSYAILGTGGLSANTREFRHITTVRPKPRITLAFQRDVPSAKSAKRHITAFKNYQIQSSAMVPMSGAGDWAELVEWETDKVKSLAEISAPLDDFGLSRCFTALAKQTKDLAAGKIKPIPLPWRNLTWVFGDTGIPPGTVGLLVARTGVGKTWLTYHLGLHVAKSVPTLIINTEMMDSAIGARLLAIVSKNSKVAYLADCDVIAEELFDHQKTLESLPLETTPADAKRLSDVLDLVAEKTRTHKFIIVDHLGDLDMQGRPAWESLPGFAKDLQQVAQRTNAVVLLVSHLKVADSGIDTLAYSRQMENLVDWSLGFRSVEPTVTTVSTPCGKVGVEINRSLTVRKNRCGRSDNVVPRP